MTEQTTHGQKMKFIPADQVNTSETKENDPKFALQLLLTDNGKTRFYFKDGMMRERTVGEGDNLWRTSLAYIAYRHPTLMEGMLDCLKWNEDGSIRYYRSTEKTDNDFSRDQLTMFLTAMSLSGEDVKKYVKATKWKLSRRFSLTVDMWLWMRALGGSKLARTLFYLIEIPIAKTYQLWNKSNLSKGKFPSYAVHLLAWQVYALNDPSNFNKSLGSIVTKMADNDNYLIKSLLDYPVSLEDVLSVKPETGFQWQRDKFDVNPIIRELTVEEAEFNTIDIDVLKAIYQDNY